MKQRTRLPQTKCIKVYTSKIGWEQPIEKSNEKSPKVDLLSQEVKNTFKLLTDKGRLSRIDAHCDPIW